MNELRKSYRFDREPDFIARQTENEVLDALEKLTEAGVNGSCTYQGNDTFLMIGQVGKMKVAEDNTAHYIYNVIDQTIDAQKKSIAVSKTEDLWVFAVHFSKETNRTK